MAFKLLAALLPKLIVQVVALSDQPVRNTSNAEATWNISLAFFPNDRSGACEDGQLSDIPVLTTSSLPLSHVCFNVSDIFEQSHDVGYQQDIASNVTGHARPNGVHWLLENQDAFNSKANYSHIWIKQVNSSSEEAQVGEWGAWELVVYGNPDCRDVSHDDPKGEKRPWYGASCQTGKGGQCHTLPYSIQSFNLRSNQGLQRIYGDDGCMEWSWHTVDVGTTARISVFAASLAATMTMILLC